MESKDLDLLKRLQPKIKEAMGEWQHGDMYCHKENTEIDFYCQDCLDYHIFSIKMYKDAIRIPPLYDTERPERSLWGILNWSKYDCQFCVEKIEVYELDRQGRIIFTTGIHDPYTAMLLALCEQENV